MINEADQPKTNASRQRNYQSRMRQIRRRLAEQGFWFFEWRVRNQYSPFEKTRLEALILEKCQALSMHAPCHREECAFAVLRGVEDYLKEREGMTLNDIHDGGK